MSSLWHPFSDLHASRTDEVMFTRGEGCYLWDSEGRRYIDALAGLWYCNVGYGRDSIAQAALGQYEALATYHTFQLGSMIPTNRPAEALAERLRSISPVEDASVFFTSGGSDGIDTAGKLIRRYWQAVGSPERTIIVKRSGAFHGMNAFGTSLAGIELNRDGYGELIPDVVEVDRDDPQDFEDLVHERGPTIAGFIGEPVIGAGGVHPPTPGYWTRIQELCGEAGILLVVDEVITGFGRLGEWFGSVRFEIEPDIVVTAKGLTSGYFPLGALLISPKIREPFRDGRAGKFRHGYTYSGHPVGCAVALANLEILREENLLEHSETMAAYLDVLLRDLSAHPLVDSVRSIGLMGAVQLDADAVNADPTVGDRLVDLVRAEGIITRTVIGPALQVSPPLVVERAELDEIVGAYRLALDAVT